MIDTKILLLCIAGVSISDSDAVSLIKPDFNTYTGILAKHGHELIIAMKESVKSLYDQKGDKDKQAEDAKKAGKPKRKKF